MITIKKQYYGIKFPFTANNISGFFVDLNNELKDKVASEIAHVLLTTKRSRLRQPDFGTDIIKSIFEPNDDLSWDFVVGEAKNSVKKYVENATLDDIQVMSDEQNPQEIYLDIRYSTRKGNKLENNRLVIKL